MNRIERIAETLRANKVDFDEDFLDLDARGYASDACQEFSEQIVGDLVALAERGVNEGFGAKERDAIADLIKLALRLSDKKAPARLAKFSEQREKIVSGVREEERREGKMDIREETLKYIDVTRKGTEVLMQRINIGERLKEMFSECVGLLDQMREEVCGAWDNSTKNAADIAGKLTDELLAFQKKLAYYTCDAEAVAGLKKALGYAKEWKELKTAAKRGTLADDKYIDAKVGYSDPFDIEELAYAPDHTDSIGIFRDTLRRFDEDTQRFCNTEALEAERDALYKRQAEIEKELDSLTVQYMNGEMSAELCDEKSSELEEEKADVAAELSDYGYEIEEKNKTRRVREKSSKEFARLSNKIMEYESDPVMLSLLAQNIDFSELCGALLGRMNKAEIKEVVSKILYVFDIMKVRGGFTAEVRDAWRDIRTELNMGREEERRARKQDARVAQEAQKEKNTEAERRMQERIARMQNRQGAAPKNEARTEEGRTVMPLSDNDK